MRLARGHFTQVRFLTYLSGQPCVCARVLRRGLGDANGGRPAGEPNPVDILSEIIRGRYPGNAGRLVAGTPSSVFAARPFVADTQRRSDSFPSGVLATCERNRKTSSDQSGSTHGSPRVMIRRAAVALILATAASLLAQPAHSTLYYNYYQFDVYISYWKTTVLIVILQVVTLYKFHFCWVGQCRYT